jgi:hypothetical protein
MHRKAYPMQDPQPPTANDVDRCVDDLRAALAAHGIALPSLHADLPIFAGAYAPPAGWSHSETATPPPRASSPSRFGRRPNSERVAAA